MNERVLRRADPSWEVDATALVTAHRRAGALVTVAVAPALDLQEAVIVLFGDDGRIFGVQVRPHPDEALGELADTGVWVVAEAAEALLDDWSVDDALERLVAMDAGCAAHPVG